MDERGKGLSSHQFYPDEVAHAPATPAKLGQPDPNTICKNWFGNPFNEAIFEETSARSFSCWEDNLGSTSQIYDFGGGMCKKLSMDDLELWPAISCKDLLAYADATIRKGSNNGDGGSSSGGGSYGRGASETQQYGLSNLHNYICDLNGPPETVTEPPVSTGLSLQFTPVTPDHVKRAEHNQVASDMVFSNGDERMKLAADNTERFNLDEQSQAGVSTLAEANQDFEKGLTEQTDLNETPQPKEKRRKHRPKVVTEGKPRRARKPATPKPETPKPTTGKRKYVRRKGVQKPTETPSNPSMVETSGPVDPSPDQQTKKSCKRKINFEESEQGTEVVVEKTHIELVVDKTHLRSQEVETCQKIDETKSASPITPSKTELPQGRSRKDYTKAKCSISFSQETHDKGPSGVPSPNESLCSTSASFNKGELSSEIDEIKRLHEKTLGNCRESLEAYLSIYTDFNSGDKQGMQLPVINKRKKVESVMTTATNVRMQISGQNSKSKKGKALTVPDSVSFAGMIDGRHQQNTYMKSHAAGFQVSIASKKKTMKKSMVPSSYHEYQRFTNQIGYHPNLRCKIIYGIDELINQFEQLHINNDAVIPYLSGHHEKNALVVYQQDRSLVPYEGVFNPLKKRKPRAKVDLDDETNRVWMLLLEDINSEGIDGTDEDKAKWWEEERRVFRGRADSFIARMHLVQGDRRFSRWKGSVLDSVVGVFLTQNVSDHLSSSAFMSLAARFPLKPKGSNEPLHEEESVLSVKEPCLVDESADHGPMILQEADSYEEKEAANSYKFSKSIVSNIDLNDSSECEVAGLSERDLVMYKEAVIDQIEVNEIFSSQNSTDTSPSSVQSSIANTAERLNSCSMHNSEKVQKEGSTATALGGCTSFVELLHMQGPKAVHERNIIQKNSGTCASEESGISAEFASQTTVQMVKTTSSQESAKSCNNCEVQEVFDTTNITTELSKASESKNIVEASGKIVQKVKKEKTGKKQIKVEWDKLRLQAEVKQKRERTPYTMDSLDYEAVRTVDVNEVADAIKERGMNNVLAGRIKDVLDRLVKEHGSMDLEWLRDVPPDKAKEYLLSFRGLGLKSVECIRLLTLHHLAFPVDTNVGRIAVRLGWVPLQPLPESLQLHLLELYPVLESIQKYLWPRLCKLDQRTLYELHYQMITFGKVFCTKTKPNCNACPLRGECRHFASAFTSARLSLPAPGESIASLTENRTGQSPIGMIDLPPPSDQLKPLSEVQNCNLVIEETATPGPIVEVPTTAGPIVEVPATPEPIVEVPASPEPEQMHVLDIEDFCDNSEEIPTIKLNIEEFTQNLQTYMERHMELGEGDMSKALVALTPEAASIPTPKLKNVSQLRTEHQVYELPDSHPLLEGLDTREPDDPCSYLLAIWTPGETADSIQPPEGQCCSQESGILCNEETCFFCNSTREANSQTVRGTLLIPCRTAMRGSFPLNGTYFQVNEVFADHESSLNPIAVPRAWLWNLPRRTVYFGTSIPSIFKGLTTEDIQYCFWRGFVCVRGFDQKTRAPRPLMARLHFPASRLKKPKPKTDEKEKLMQ